MVHHPNVLLHQYFSLYLSSIFSLVSFVAVWRDYCLFLTFQSSKTAHAQNTNILKPFIILWNENSTTFLDFINFFRDFGMISGFVVPSELLLLLWSVWLSFRVFDALLIVSSLLSSREFGAAAASASPILNIRWRKNHLKSQISIFK